jgi:hypothetical protein
MLAKIFPFGADSSVANLLNNTYYQGRPLRQASALNHRRSINLGSAGHIAEPHTEAD